LTALSDKIEAEAEKYKNLNQAITLKQNELKEIYGIEKEKSEYLGTIAEEKSKNEKKQVRENTLADEKEQTEKEIKQNKNEFEQFRQTKSMELDEREKHITERELIMGELREKVDSFPAQLEKAVIIAEKQSDKISSERFSQNEALLLKGFEGEKNVLDTKIISLESLAKDQAKQIDKLNIQQEKAYKQVQDIASKAVAGSVDRPHNITVQATKADG